MGNNNSLSIVLIAHTSWAQKWKFFLRAIETKPILTIFLDEDIV